MDGRGAGTGRYGTGTWKAMDNEPILPSTADATTDKVKSLLNPPGCPRCGQTMRLSRIEPGIHGPVSEQITYDCACGATFSRAVGAPG
jgi:hypothetical protein